MSVPEEFWTDGDDELPETSEEKAEREEYEATYKAAKAVLHKAIAALVQAAYDDDSAYVNDYVLITHVSTAELEQSASSGCTITIPEDQPLVHTAGLLARANAVIARQ